MSRLRVVDLETTGTAPPAEIIEIGRTDVLVSGPDIRVDLPLSRLYRPLRGIPPETMAVHHITDADFPPDAVECSAVELRQAVWGGEAPDALVAHNCAFEQAFITDAATDDLPWICTYKVALHLWPDAPRHSNQVLRYWRGLTLDLNRAMPPHRAGPDAWVTAHLLAQMLLEASVDQMIAWTREPKPMPVIPFGKHRGLPWAHVPLDYLQWMAGQKDMDKDVTWNAQQELVRRR